MEDTKSTKCLNILEKTMFWKVLTKGDRRTMPKDSMTLKAFEYIYVWLITLCKEIEAVKNMLWTHDLIFLVWHMT